METTALLVFAGALFLNAGSPGPSIAVLVSQVLTRGAATVVPFVAAMWIGEAAWLAAAVAGLSVLAEQLHHVFLAVKWAGLAYLALLAWRMWHAPVEPDAIGATAPQGSTLARFASGMALTLGNPKIMVFYVALLPSLVDVKAIGLSEWALLSAVQIAVMAVTDLGWIALAARVRGLFRSRRALRFVHRGSALAMGGAAAVIATRS
ncbi:LysE family translocator [Pinisolibacter sp.]|uniref:LysE family translocator n=1 Tax=Pinisolibacter sp. TaxID=2172024 RepID=UPI002FDEF953